MKILQIEGDAVESQACELKLKVEGFQVYTTDLGEEGVDLAKRYDHAAVLLTLDLPDMAGLDVVRQMRAAKVFVPLLVFGPDEVMAKVAALRAGADDYMVRPCHVDELVARVRALVRRAAGTPCDRLEVGRITLDIGEHVARVGGQPVHLTAKEYRMLEFLMLRRGKTLSKEMFMDHLYGGRDEPQLKIVDVFMCKLRKKLAAVGAGGHIETVWGQGYTLRGGPDAVAA